MVSKERREEILEKIKKAGSEEYITEWDESGKFKSKKKSEVKKGKKSRASGVSFELRVRKDLFEKGWIVDKWSNNVDLEKKEIIPAKRKFNPFKRVMTIGTGFPDFIAFQLLDRGKYNIIGVEVKVNGLLDKEEKEKCRFLLDKKIFNEIWIAKKKKKGNKILIEYEDFKDKYIK